MTATAPPKLHRRTRQARSGKWAAEDTSSSQILGTSGSYLPERAWGPYARTTATPARSVVEAGRLGQRRRKPWGSLGRSARID
jgi:hypothetical protein